MAASSERCSLLAGLLILMAASVPRYLAGGHDTHLALLAIAGVAVAALAVFQWWLLPVASRAALPALMRRLVACLVIGLLATGIWHALFGAWSGWPLLVSHGAALGLLLHALGLWWKPAAKKGKE
ncbi:hypothetical protein [Halomonas elongata]|uniref:Transmembrane protein n=2 Tax=Halomonas elongata TaxID=2746 RepID=E1VCQ2_HALED|nr:hypothetical protein [Halomonas elongata]MDL4861147.1 hypothetical protein [Halomonas elongata]OBX36465.1 hypothetical protein A8U91_00807 [Halomonas elongata]WBF19692.1 hypothetical protein LM502_08380 [Halomonas elongata]WPU48556.1 hypothetical protein SR933_06605 [Halomonas elongata DSM 2581]WVI73121.1 hypothetical protein VO226_07710 [Halomonas elongata]